MGSVVQGAYVTISCNNHNKLLVDGIQKLLREEYLVDANVTFNSASFKVHRLILAVFLPTLKEHMNNAHASGVAGSDSQVLSLDYVASEANDVKVLLEFLYSGQVIVQRERIQHIDRLAKELNVESLAKAIGEWENGQQATDEGVVSSGELVTTASASDSTMQQEQIPEEPPVRCNDTACAIKIGGSQQEEEGSNVCDQSHLAVVPPVGRHFTRSNARHVKQNKTMPHRMAASNNASVAIVRENDDNETSEWEPEENSEDSDWSPVDSAKRRASKLAGKAAIASNAGLTRKCRTSRVLSENVGDHKEDDVIDQIGHKVHRAPSEDQRGKLDGCQAVIVKRRRSRKEGKRPLSTSGDASTAEAELPTCELCRQKFLTPRSLLFHRKICGQQGKEHVCCECRHQAVSRASLRRHVRLVHKNMAPAKDVFLSCPKCDFTCNAKYKLRGHILRRHTAEREHKCPECEYSAMYKGEIERHVSRAHRKETRYVCELCGGRYQMRGSLNLHMLTKHQGVKPYKCKYCDKEYTQGQTLKLHVQTKHTLDVHKYVCEVCGNSFIQKWRHRYHMQNSHGVSIEPAKKFYAPRNPPLQQETGNDSITVINASSVP